MVGEVADLRLGVFQQTDVPRSQQQARGFVEGDRFHRDFDGQQLAALVAPEHFLMMNPALDLQFGQQRRALLLFSPDADLINRAADHFISAVTGQAAETVVDLQIAPGIAFGDGDGVGAGVERLGEFLFAGLQCRFRALLLGDVAQGGDDARLVADADLSAGNHAGQGLPVLVLDENRHIVQALFANHLFDSLQAFRRGIPQADFVGAATDHVGGAPAEGLGEAGVDLDELAGVLAGHADRVRADLEQGGEFLFGGHQPLFAFDLVGDVEQGAGHAQRQAVFIAIEPGAAFQIA
ncbi:hypothetical protein D3C71_1008230 [compost metagenome]